MTGRRERQRRADAARIVTRILRASDERAAASFVLGELREADRVVGRALVFGVAFGLGCGPLVIELARWLLRWWAP